MKNSLITFPPSQLNPKIRWVVLAIWLLIVLAHLFHFVVDLSSDFAALQSPCLGALGDAGDCDQLAISPAEVAVLSSWGVTLRTYAAVMLAAPAILLLGYWLLGGLILWRQRTNWLGLTVSLALISFPITIVASAPDWATTTPAWVIFGSVVGFVGSVIFVLFLYLLPNGRYRLGKRV